MCKKITHFGGINNVLFNPKYILIKLLFVKFFANQATECSWKQCMNRSIKHSAIGLFLKKKKNLKNGKFELETLQTLYREMLTKD